MATRRLTTTSLGAAPPGSGTIRWVGVAQRRPLSHRLLRRPLRAPSSEVEATLQPSGERSSRYPVQRSDAALPSTTLGCSWGFVHVQGIGARSSRRRTPRPWRGRTQCQPSVDPSQAVEPCRRGTEAHADAVRVGGAALAWCRGLAAAIASVASSR